MIKYTLPVSPFADIQKLYRQFNAPICAIDCGEKCRVNNPNGVPFCCDINHAVPAVYDQETGYYKGRTDLWFAYDGDLKAEEAELPTGMRMMSCLGADKCQRDFRSLSCRQFPFFPYVTSDHVFLGLALEWEFKGKCWLFDHLDLVTDEYREQFIQVYDEIFAFHQDIFENYAEHSANARDWHAHNKQTITILSRDMRMTWIDPTDERILS